MKKFRQGSIIKSISYIQRPSTCYFFDLSISYLDGLEESCIQSSKDIVKALKNYSLSAKSLLVILKNNQEIPIDAIEFELINDDDNNVPNYQVTVQSNFGAIQEDLKKSAQDLVKELALVTLDDNGFLIIDPSQKRQIKQMISFNIKYEKMVKGEQQYLFTNHYDDGSYINICANKDYFLAHYCSGFFIDDTGRLHSNGHIPTKIAKEKKEVSEIHADWNGSVKRNSSLVNVVITYTDNSRREMRLIHDAIERKYHSFLFQKPIQSNLYHQVDLEKNFSPTLS